MSYITQRRAFESAIAGAVATALGTESGIVRTGVDGDERGMPYVRCKVNSGNEEFPASELYRMSCEITVCSLIAEDDMADHEARCDKVFSVIADTAAKTKLETSGDIAVCGIGQQSVSESNDGSAQQSTITFDVIGFAK